MSKYIIPLYLLLSLPLFSVEPTLRELAGAKCKLIRAAVSRGYIVFLKSLPEAYEKI